MTSSEPTRSLTARTPEDLLAIVPVILGFTPTDSVVMLTFGAARTFHARIDLPTELEQLPAIAGILAGPARRHGADGAVVVLYTADPVLAAAAQAILVPTFAASGIAVVGVLRADGRCWWPMLPESSEGRTDGTPYHVASHPFVVQSVVDGDVIHASRSALAATLRERDPDLAADVAVAIGRLTDRDRPADQQSEAAWVSAAVDAQSESVERPDARITARLLVDLQDAALCEAVLLRMEGGHAKEHVALWTHVVSHAPEHLAAPPAALLAFAAWLCGNGALAWCALDRCAEVDPGHPMAEVLTGLLDNAVPPAGWAEVRG